MKFENNYFISLRMITRQNKKIKCLQGLLEENFS